MAKNGFRAFDSDMHVFEPADLYIKYMNPKWGERIPRGKPRTKHGMTRYFLGDGKPIRPPEDVDFLGSALVTADSYVRNNRDVVTRFARGAVETIRFIKTEPKRSSDILQRIYRENDPAITARRYQLLTGVYADYPYVLPSPIQSVLDVLREDGKIKDTPPAQTFMDMSFLQAVEKERQASGQK